MKTLRISAFYRTMSGCDFHRVKMALDHIPLQEGDSILHVTEKSKLQPDNFDTDIVLFNRQHFLPPKVLQQVKDKYGFKLVVDLDDYWRLYKHHILYESWKKADVTNKIIASIELADVVTVTNVQLWQKVREEFPDKKVEILPNSIPINFGQFIPNPIAHEGTNITYIAGSSHLADLNSIRNLFKKFSGTNEFKFILSGFSKSPKGVTVWDKMHSIVKPLKNLELRAPLPVTQYMQLYNDCDIAIAPLENNEFNQYKSVLKTLEAGCKGIPIICSNMLPYSEHTNIQGVNLCNSVSEWYNTIKTYTKNPAKIKEDGLALQEFVAENYNLYKINQNRYSLYKSLL